MWKWVVIAILVVGVMTCPDKDDHEKEIRKFLQANMNASQDGAMASLFMAAMGGGGLLEESVMAQLKLKCDNYLIFSIGTVLVNGERQAISLGAFGNVVLNDEDE